METRGPLEGVCRDYLGFVLGLYWDYGKDNGSYYSILKIYRDDGKANGSYCLGLRAYERLGFRVLG